MNEFKKLFSSVLLLAAGFAAASLFSPPEVIDRLASLMQPAAPEGATLQPLAANAPPLDSQGWPELPTAATKPATAEAEEPAWGAPVAPSVQRASWPGPADAVEPTDDAPLQVDAPRRALKPIPRSTETVAGPKVTPIANDPTEWSPFATPEPTPPATPPTLDDNPYAQRPGQPAAVGPAEFPELRSPEPLARRTDKAALQSHIVTDGDTLESLAERYLGDPARAGELFELNNDRLDQPDLLPIGMVLRTPKERRAANPAPTERGPSATPANPTNAFSTISSVGDSPFAPQAEAARPLTPIHRGEAPLSAAAAAGPVDPWYAHEVMWDSNRW